MKAESVNDLSGNVLLWLWFSKGPSIFDVHKIGFLTPIHPSTWARPPNPFVDSTCGRNEIHIALLKQLVQWPSGPKAEIRLYDCNLFKTVLLVIYIIYIAEKFPLFIQSKDEILVKMPTSLHENT